MEAEEAEEFKKAVDEWRTMKGKGEGAPVVVEAGGGFARQGVGDESPQANASAAEGDDSDERDNREESIDFSALEGSLSVETLAALRSHVAEQAAPSDGSSVEASGLPVEDFGMSQFWWDDDSADRLGQECLDIAMAIEVANGGGGGGGERCFRIGILSAPSVWFGIQRLLAARDASDNVKFEVTLFEFDRRFASSAGSNFTYFDYNELGMLPADAAGSYDCLLAGPPYVATACIDKYAEAFTFLAKSSAVPRAIVIGATLEEPLAERGYEMAEDMALSYQSKFCTPMRLYRKY
jgi:hypothetical protein